MPYGDTRSYTTYEIISKIGMKFLDVSIHMNINRVFKIPSIYRIDGIGEEIFDKAEVIRFCLNFQMSQLDKWDRQC